MFSQANPDNLPKLSYAAVAPAGSTQSDATAITKALNVVTGADATKGVILPATTVLRDRGVRIVIINATAAVLKIYPASTGTIDGGSASAALSLAASKKTTLYCTGANTWYSILGA